MDKGASHPSSLYKVSKYVMGGVLEREREREREREMLKSSRQPSPVCLITGTKLSSKKKFDEIFKNEIHSFSIHAHRPLLHFLLSVFLKFLFSNSTSTF
jgi:hypothetical protein